MVADGKIKLKKSSVHVTDIRKTGQTKTAAGGMEYRGRNGGGAAQGGKENGVSVSGFEWYLFKRLDRYHS